MRIISERIERIALDDLAPDPDQPRKSGFASKELDSAFDAVGDIIQPLSIIPKEENHYTELNGKHLIFDGERRWRLARRKELASVPCLFVEVDERDRLARQMALDGAKAKLRPVEVAEGVGRLLENGYKQIDIATMLAKSSAWVSRVAPVSALSEQALEKCRELDLGFEKLCLVASMPTPELVEALLDQCGGEQSLAKIKAAAKLLKKPKRENEKPAREEPSRSVSIAQEQLQAGLSREDEDETVSNPEEAKSSSTLVESEDARDEHGGETLSKQEAQELGAPPLKNGSELIGADSLSPHSEESAHASKDIEPDAVEESKPPRSGNDTAERRDLVPSGAPKLDALLEAWVQRYGIYMVSREELADMATEAGIADLLLDGEEDDHKGSLLKHAVYNLVANSHRHSVGDWTVMTRHGPNNKLLAQLIPSSERKPDVESGIDWGP